MKPKIVADRVAAVVIGRNEGARLLRCLKSIENKVDLVVYVDSGSTDGSAEAANDTGATVIELDMNRPFTAARARNVGAAVLPDEIAYIQFVDADCAVHPGWIAAAHTFLNDTPDAAVACGRRRETAPETSIYNRLCDAEWDTPIGQARSCGGDALIRREAFQQVGGFRDDLIAGEEPEMCVRIRQAGWTVWRLDHEMTLHDAAITRFSQWWTRSKRAGHAYAEGAYLHGAPPEKHCVAQTRRAVIWGLAIPAAIILAVFAVSPWALLAILVYPLQIVRLAQRDGGGPFGWAQAFFMTVGKFAETQGVLTFWTGRLMRRRANLMEYKGG